MFFKLKSEDMGDGLKIFPENITHELEIYGCPITSMASHEVREIVERQYQENLKPTIFYETTRGVKDLLTGEIPDPARLPDFPDETALELFRRLPKGSTWLDVGCGSGTFIAEVLQDINPQINAYGFDSREWRNEDMASNLRFGHRQEKLSHLSLGNIDNLQDVNFGPEKFDMITCAAVLRHLPDYWGAILRMVNLLKQDGVFLSSYVPRIAETYSDNMSIDDIIYGHPVDDIDGNIVRPEYGLLYKKQKYF